VPQAAVENMIRAAPPGNLARRAWYFYEIMTGRSLDIENAPGAAAIELLEPDLYFTGKPRLSKRHRVRDNLLGIGRFCPVIRRTKALTEFLELDLAANARETVGRTSAYLVARAASFMLLADSRASFEIEGERPPRNRLERWGRAVLQAGKNRLTLEEIIRLQRVLIEDNRFIHAGLRPDSVFLGERDHHGDPLPEFIGARPEDLADLGPGAQGSGHCLRFCLCPSVPRRQRAPAPLSDPSCPRRTEIHAAGNGVPGFVRNAGPHR
jgi:hypothetical protein